MDSVAELLAVQVRRAPDATAVIDRGGRLTYRELDFRSNRLAHELVACGVGVETRVGLCCERTAEMIIAMLGIVKAGGAYVPIDRDYPASRRALIVADAGLAAVVTQRALSDQFAVPTIAVDDKREPASQPPTVTIRRDDALYVLYTSGSTGRPKGVVGLHGATASRLRWQQEVYPFGTDEVASARTTLGFVDSVAEIFAPLAFGAPLVVIGDEAQHDATVAIDELAATRATRIVLVPSLLATMLDVMPDIAQRVPELKYWFIGGEPVPVPLVARFKRALPGRKLINIYGATELSGDATYFDFDAMPDGLATSPIGLPLPGVFARIVDPELAELPDGETGEIVISGSCLSRGYLERPELTAERFVGNPFAEGGRLYRTRDLGRRLPSGDIQYLGRLDQLVKIRGFRIELGEVEATVGAAPGVVHAAALARDEQLVVFYTSERELVTGELRAHVATRLPPHAVPNRFVHLAELPRNANGKIDRGALAALPLASELGPPPATDDERRIAAIWQDALGLSAVGRTQSFFELGGTSLAAMRVVAKLHDAFGVAVPLAVLFDQPTIAQLATWLATAARTPAHRPIVASHRAVPAVFPLSHFQFPFWMFRALTGGVSIVADAFAIPEPVDVERLQRAFSCTVASFDALWMRYPRFRAVQEIAPRTESRFEVRDGDIEAEAAANNARAFELSQPPHVHARLVRGRLLIAVPHIAVDMASLELFRATLERHYVGGAAPAPAGANLHDLVTWERETHATAADRDHWLSIGGRPALNPLPARLFARRSMRAWSTRSIDANALAGIDRYARRHAITRSMAMVGAIYAALARIADVDDPSVLVMVEKRDRAELRELFTNLTAIMPCRVSGGRADVQDVASRVAAQLVAGAEHSDALMRTPTFWNDFWERAPRGLRWLIERACPELVAQYLFALVPLERKHDRVMFVVNILPEVTQRPASQHLVRARGLPEMLVPGDLVTGTDALLDRTLQIHVTNAGGVAINLYGGGLSQAGLDEINDCLAGALVELT
jgi:amino acid adenylation domain-containing protein